MKVLYFQAVHEVIAAYQCEQVDLHAKINVRIEHDEMVQTTVGRVILFEALPDGSDFHWVNKVLKKVRSD